MIKKLTGKNYESIETLGMHLEKCFQQKETKRINSEKSLT